MSEDLFARVRQRAEEYRSVTERYDRLLAKAHQAGAGRAAALQYLQWANNMAEDVMNALKAYQDAVADLLFALRNP